MKKNYGFSLVELMVTLIILSCITAALTPVITKKLQSQGIVVGSGGGSESNGGSINIDVGTDCDLWQNCALCSSEKCVLCREGICANNEYIKHEDCSCNLCSDFNEQCIECQTGGCTKCNSGFYVDNLTCKICPVGSYCDGLNKFVCPEGTITTIEGQSSCELCPSGYACANGNITQCSSGTYATGGYGNCLACSSKTAQCAACDSQTGVCSACESGFTIFNSACVVENPCGALATLITLSDRRLCMTKYNIGDGGLTMPTGATHIVDTTYSESTYTAPFCWVGQTSEICNNDDTRYSGCYRTVCNYLAAIYLCQYLTYSNLTWKLPTVADWKQIINEKPNIIFGQSNDSLLFCLSSTNGANSVCTLGDNKCKETSTDGCYPYNAWSLDQVDVGDGNIHAWALSFNSTSTSWSAPDGSYASSVRCVSYL